MPLSQTILDRVSAEIRQHMDGIAALADQLARHPMANDAEACAAGVAGSAASVRRMLDRAMDIRAAEDGALAMTQETIRLSDLVDDLQERWAARGLLAGVSLLTSYDGPPDAGVVGDRRRLGQMFDGLVAEAAAGGARGGVEIGLKAQSVGGEIRIEGRVRGARAWSSAEASLDELADRVGVEAALEARLARRLLNILGGSLHDEPGPGRAHVMVFELTLQAVQQSPAEPAQRAMRPAHVLVVDDNATNRMVAQALCEMFACTSEAAVDGIEAVEMAATGRFDLVLMDIRMPRMDGVAAARAIRGLPGPVGATPIVALTANADSEDVAHYLSAGMDGVVEKPMKAEHLLAALQQALEPTDVRIAI
jgi:CheY-like chemotaxis protein